MSLLVDALGKKHPPVDPGKAVRIVSLVPSITELLCDLGLASRVVGRTGFCIHPQSAVSAIPKVGGTKVEFFVKNAKRMFCVSVLSVNTMHWRWRCRHHLGSRFLPIAFCIASGKTHG